MNKTFRLGKNNLNMDDGAESGEVTGMRIYAERLSSLVREEKAKGTEEADLCREIGVGIRNIGQWKTRGTIVRDERTLWRLCRRLGTHPNYLVGWSDERAPREEPPIAAEIDAELRVIKRRLESKGR